MINYIRSELYRGFRERFFYVFVIVFSVVFMDFACLHCPLRIWQVPVFHILIQTLSL